MEYKVGDKLFSISYQELRSKYHQFCDMTDAEFLSSLPSAAHFACIVSWFKEIGAESSIGDNGIVHELIHLMDIKDYADSNLSGIRQQFKDLLRLD